MTSWPITAFIQLGARSYLVPRGFLKQADGSLLEARVVIEDRRRDYNHYRLRRSLDELPPPTLRTTELN